MSLKQPNPTHACEDNAATVEVSNNENATKCLCHADLRHFAILDWVQNGDIILKKIVITDDPGDELAKPLGAQLRHRYSDTLLGKRLLSHVST